MAEQQPDPQLIALILAYQAQSEAIRSRLERFVKATWKQLGLYRQPQQAAYVRDVTPVILGAQRQISSITTVYLGHQRQLQLREPFRPVAVDPRLVTGAPARMGSVSPAEVHARPFDLVWRQLHDLPHESGAIEQAITAGEKRAVELALDDVQLAKNHTAVAVAKNDDRVKYVERVLEGTHSCGLCIVASTQRYHPGRLLPIHGGCDCSQAWHYTDEDPGHILHLDRLQDIHDRIEKRFGASSPGARSIPGNNYDTALQYRDVLVTHEHGELGPVLGVRGAEFTGPGDLN